MRLVGRWSFWGAAVVLGAFAGCNALWGTGDLSFGDANDGGSSTSTGGSGGGGGGAGGSAGSGSGAGGGSAGAGGCGGAGGGCAPPCHPTDLVADFEGSILPPSEWELQGAASLLSLHDGMFFYEPLPHQNSSQWAGPVTVGRYDLRDCATWIEVPSVANSTGYGMSYFEIWHESGQATLSVDEDQMTFTFMAQGTFSETSHDYVPSADRWWRIREESGVLHLETSPDGESWTVGNSVSSPGWVGDVKIGFGGRLEVDLTNPGHTAFDNLNLLP